MIFFSSNANRLVASSTCTFSSLLISSLEKILNMNDSEVLGVTLEDLITHVKLDGFASPSNENKLLPKDNFDK